MSVKALDDPERQIDVSDELESFFYILLYEAVMLLPSNCPDLKGYVSSYFHALEQPGSQFRCSDSKRSSMMNGELILANNQHLKFFKSAASTTHPASARVPLPAKPPSDIAQSGSVAGPESHPIQHILHNMVRLFRHQYVESGDLPDEDGQPSTMGKNIESFDTDPRLEMYKEFSFIVMRELQGRKWPTNDKLESEVDAQYNALKRPIRTSDADVMVDQPATKKRATNASGSSA